MFWKQSNRLVQGPKLWHALRAARPGATTAQLFWWFNMHADVEYSVTPRPLYPADGRKVFDIHTQPMGLREEAKAALGNFRFRGSGGRRRGGGRRIGLRRARGGWRRSTGRFEFGVSAASGLRAAKVRAGLGGCAGDGGTGGGG